MAYRNPLTWLLVWCALGGAARGAAQTRALSSNDLAVLLASGTSHDRVLATARASCIDFLIDAAHERPLRIAGADSVTIAGLREVCYRGTGLEVQTDPVGAEVRLDGRRVGVSPWSGPMSAGLVDIELRRGDISRRVSVQLNPSQFVRVVVRLPDDTLALPSAPTRDEIARLRLQAQSFSPSKPRPVAPMPPGRASGIGGAVIGGLLGAGSGAGLGAAVCKKSTLKYSSFTQEQTTYLVPSGTASQIEPACVAAGGGAGLVVGGVIGTVIAHLGHGAKVRAYEEARRAYTVDLARWQSQTDSERFRFSAEKQAGLDSLTHAADEYDRVTALNAQTRARNAELPAPVVQTERARRFEQRGAVIDP